jgi:hypothetical protein
MVISQIQNLLKGDPMECKKDGYDNRGEKITEPFKAPHANTSRMGLSHNSSYKEEVNTREISIGQACRIHPNGHTSR